MLRLTIAPLLLSAGCLYLGDLNHAPSCKVDPTTQSATKGVPITFNVHKSDPDPADTPDSLAIHHRIDSADGQPLYVQCDYSIVDAFDGSGYSVTFFRTGVFKVITTVSDRATARSPEQTVMVTIGNAPPTLSTDSKLAADQALSGMCHFFTAGLPVPIIFTGTPSDADLTAVSSYPGCMTSEPALTFQWSITPPPGSTMAVLTPWMNDGSGCAAMSSSSGATLSTMTADRVCLWPDYGPPLLSTDYGVTLTVGDGGSQTATVSTTVHVTGDSLPCINKVDPTDGSYVVDPKSPAPFDTLTVDKVNDDFDPFPGVASQLTFHWSLWRESDPVWRAIPISSNQYSPDYSVFGVGEHVRIRVEVRDRHRADTPASCTDLTLDSCEVLSCNASPCYQWKTWNLELR